MNLMLGQHLLSNSQTKILKHNFMPKKELNYNDAINEMESIISKIENQELNIDELSANVKRVAELLTYCKMKLKNTEEEVQKILKEFEEK